MSKMPEDFTREELVELINSLCYDVAPDGTGEKFELILTEDISELEKEKLVELLYKVSEALSTGARKIVI